MDFSSLFGIFKFIGLIIGVVVHESAHGYVADLLGDPTARLAGRISLNPFVHIDPFLTLLLPFFLFISGSPIIFGAAKPVPFNPYLLRDQKWGPFLVALAGPLSNLIIVIMCSFSLKMLIAFGLVFGTFQYLILFFEAVLLINLVLMVFNLIPIPPLDGSRILYLFFPSSYLNFLAPLEYLGFFLIMLFILFFGNYLTAIIYFLLKIFIPSSFLFF